MKNIESKPSQESIISKVMGATPEEEQKILEKFRDRFQHYKKLREIYTMERKKTAEEITIIDGINGYMGEFLQEYGGLLLSYVANGIIYAALSVLSRNKTTFGHDNNTRNYPLKLFYICF